MDGSVKLNGLNLGEPRKLIPPSQIQNQIQFDNTNSAAPINNNTDLPTIEDPKTPTPVPSSLATGDKSNFSNMANMASSAIAGGMGTAAVVRDLGTIGESMRSVNVQNNMTELQDRHYQDNSSSSWGGRSSNSGYNNHGYDADYGATEFVRRRGNGRVEFSGDRRYGRIESDYNSPETRLAGSNLAKGTLQGAKYGVIIGGAVSAVVNAYKVLTGKEKGSDAVGKVAADTITAGVSGAGGALAGGAATLGLASIGMGGPVGMVLAVGIGSVGAVASQMLMTKTGLYDSIVNKVKGMLGSK